jgi:hypothetical protein
MIGHDLRSKLLDGLLPALVLYLLLMLILFGLGPIAGHFGGPGLLVYILGLLAIAMFSLQRALSAGLSETTRAWYGMAAGVLAWAVVEISQMLEPASETGLRSGILLILAALTGVLLWRHGLPLGGRFFWFAFTVNWASRVFLSYLNAAAGWSDALMLFSRGLGFAAAAGTAGLLVWLFAASTRRVQRIWASLAIVMLTVFAVIIFNGY